VVRHWYDDWMAKAELHVEPRPAHSFDLAPRVCLERSAVPDANKVQRYGEALSHTGDGILNERAGEPPHRSLFLDLCIFYAES